MVAVALASVAPPGPDAIVAVTVTPAWLTALPAPSRNCTTGCRANATPPCAVADGWVVSVNWLGAPALTVMVPETACVRPVAPKLRVRSPAVPLIARLVKLATPLPSVAAVAVPPKLPPPVAIAAVTVTPAWLTALPAASRSCTAGCWANATPLCAVVDGWVVSVRWLATPALTVIVPETAGARPVALKLKARSPAVPLSERLVKVATPLALVAVNVPPSVPPPVAIAAVTVTPDWLTALPAPSRNCTTGC